MPYQGWQEIADQLAELIDDLPAGVLEEIRPYRESVGHILPQLSPTEVDTESGTGRLNSIDGLRRVLARISSQRPILLYLQDLQWASWDTASLLVDLFSRSDNIRCLVVGTWQDDVERSEGHLLNRDLDLALLDLTRIRIRGYSHEEAARAFALAGQSKRADFEWESSLLSLPEGASRDEQLERWVKQLTQAGRAAQAAQVRRKWSSQ